MSGLNSDRVDMIGPISKRPGFFGQISMAIVDLGNLAQRASLMVQNMLDDVWVRSKAGQTRRQCSA